MYDNKLELKKEMRNSCLIQRLKKPVNFVNPLSFGGGLKNGGLSDEVMGTLKFIMSFDYMGSVEFEFGAVPAAFRFIAEQASKDNLYTNIITTHDGKNIYFICPNEYIVGTENVIKSLLDDEYKLCLKEYCGLKNVISPDPKYAWYSDTVGWIELDNGFMFFIDKEMYANVCKLFGINSA